MQDAMKISEREPVESWEITKQKYVKEFDPSELISSINDNFTVGVAKGYDLLSAKDKDSFDDILKTINDFVNRYMKIEKPSYYLQGLYGLTFKIEEKINNLRN
jgi:hypothetical protein